ncbi:phthiotriol/phenolphthiotriol dimycocerosates methyltransferase [Mycobacterium sp.]|uniref:phthiotriol/phenolphthiotriol dimycocerosates methyltransferase n=1 Tax=Mycobacterium sp. TaxID=1785 RepID=UPI003C70A97E
MAFKAPVVDNPFGIIQITHKYQKYIYPLLTRVLASRDVVFLNFGYEEDPPMSLPLAASDEPNRACIQLYHRTATQVDLSGKRVQEVGCGHGGGASYLVRTLHPASYTGLDLNQAAIAFCRKRHNLPGLDFVQGNAENLPFPDQSFDAVINIESAANYPHFRRFLAEVARVLRPGGHFLSADVRGQELVADWEAALADTPMRQLSRRVINAEVLRGTEKNSQQWLDLIDRLVPVFLRRVARKTGGALISKSYGKFQSGEESYRMYSFSKA